MTLRLTVALLMCFSSLTMFAQNEQFNLTNPDVGAVELLKVSPPLKDIDFDSPITKDVVRKERLGYHKKNDWPLHEEVNPTAQPDGDDPAWQKKYDMDKAATATIQHNIVGMGYTSVNPPDPSVAVGPNHVVQMINGGSGAYFKIFDKAGNQVQAQGYMDAISGVAGAGDPVVMYDQLADRWVLTEFSATGNKLVVMVSQTPNPTGAYYIYSFTCPQFPDYPKYAIWGDAYYVTTNESSPAVYALNRAAMLAGTPTTTFQRFTIPAYGTIGFQAAAPVNLGGTATPPAGTPGLIMRMADDAWTTGIVDRLEIFSFNVNWTTPSSSTLTGPVLLPTAAFSTELCGYTSFACIPQPGSTITLDPLREVLMNRVWYRNFGTHQSIVCCHVTDVDGADRAGMRWYELRNTGSGWGIHQQGTYSPDATRRWMGSIAQNGNGDILLAYNVSASTSVYPGIRFTARNASDPLGTMSLTETTLVSGTAANGSNRYGDYSDMGVDPSDGSFWFTAEFNPASSWSTRIGHVSVSGGSTGGLTVSTTQTNVSCNGLTNGTATASATGGTTYTYAWSNGATTAAITGLAAGNYTVTATSGALTGVAVVTITQPTVLAATATSTGASSGNNGTATAAATGGTSPYTYAWSNGGTTATISGLGVGTYTATVTDANGCTATASTTVSVSLCTTYNSANVPVSISASGTPTVTSTLAIGGAATITDVNVQNLNIAHTYTSDLTVSLGSPAGTSVTLFTALCTSNDNVIINFDDESANLYSSIPCPATNNGTYRSSGALSAFDGQNQAGTWTLTIVDGFNLDGGTLNSWSVNVCVAGAPALSVSATGTNVSCNGDTNGAATATATGGSGSYTYAWSNGATTASISGLAAGVYTVTATSGSATATASVTIAQPAVLVATATGSNNTATVTATGGTTPYTYAWSNGATTTTISGVVAGVYTVTVIDNQGCSATASATVTTPSLTVTATAVNATCASNGSASASATGGTGTYSYAWSNGATTASISGLAPGTYTVTVTSGSATATSAATVSGPAAPFTATANVTNTTCGLSNGSITLTLANGTASTYLWSTGATTASITARPAGIYTVTVTSTAGCTATTSGTIAATTPLNVTLAVTHPSGANNGSLTANPTGASAPYTYLWSGSLGTAQTISNLGNGTYTVTVTAQGGCTKTARQQLYCVMTGNSTSEWIQRIQFSTTNNTSGNNGGYGNFTTLPAANVVRNVSTPIVLVPGYAGAAVSERWRVWVDNNNDGDFADSGENVRSIAGTNTLNSTFTIPTAAPLGTHRMRVAMRRSSYAAACGAISNGEGEDYLINVTASAALQSDMANTDNAEGLLSGRMTLQPNPASDMCVASFETLEAGKYIMVVADMNGRVVMQQTIEAQKGDNQLSLDMTNFANGMYTVSINGIGYHSHKTLIVSH